MRRVVHSSVRYPRAMAPSTRMPTSRLNSPGFNLGGRPGAGFAFSPASPRSRRASRQCITELAWHPSVRAMDHKDHPSFSKDAAITRRASNSFGEPLGRMMMSSSGILAGTSLYCITYAEVNNTGCRAVQVVGMEL